MCIFLCIYNVYYTYCCYGNFSLNFSLYTTHEIIIQSSHQLPYQNDLYIIRLPYTVVTFTFVFRGKFLNNTVLPQTHLHLSNLTIYSCVYCIV